MAVDWSRLVELLRNHERFLLTSHVRPDCDSLGSELGLAGVLESLGKKVWIVNADPTPENLRFIDPDNKIQTLGQDYPGGSLPDVELLMVLDTSAWQQLGDMGEVLRKSQAHKAVLDHHRSSDDLGAELFKDVECESTGRLVVQTANSLGVALTPEIARPLFAAMVTDTGWFRFNSTTGDTLRAAGQLLDAGASPDDLYRWLHEQDSLARLHLVGRALTRIATEVNGRLAHTAIGQSDVCETGAVSSDSEGIVNSMLQIETVEAAVIFVEQPDGRVKVSFRSRDDILDCSQLAEHFSGGGHRNAAGAMLDGPVEDARELVINKARELISVPR